MDYVQRLQIVNLQLEMEVIWYNWTWHWTWDKTAPSPWVRLLFWFSRSFSFWWHDWHRQRLEMMILANCHPRGLLWYFHTWVIIYFRRNSWVLQFTRKQNVPLPNSCPRMLKLTLFSMLMYLILIQRCYKDIFLRFKLSKTTLFHCSQTSLPVFSEAQKTHKLLFLLISFCWW